MCFSVEVEKELKKIAERFTAQVSVSDKEHFFALMKKGEDLDWAKKALNLSRKPSTNIFKSHDQDGRIFPGSFTDVMVMENGQRLIKPMRYRVRPAGAKAEIPSKFNVFNARLDSLENRPTWKSIFMRNHGLLPFKRFFEWVDNDAKKKLISFYPDRYETMWAPCLWDYWENAEEGIAFHSFAIITDGPPREVSSMGHDRCPIFLKENLIDEWLRPEGKTKSEIYRILKNKQEVFYHHEFSA